MSRNILWGAAAFLVAFVAGPLAQSGFLSLMPGNLGDARLNNYLLENVYQFLAGRSQSLWHLGFFSPFPYVLGFSENLFGSAPVYVVARLVTGESDTAFQVWFLAGYGVNFASAYYVLRRFGYAGTAACIGALIFAFALPVSARSGHAQLQYRFGVPLAIGMFVLFLERKDWRLLLASVGWLVWQFCCSVYIGFFTLLFLVAVGAVYLARNLASGTGSMQRVLVEFRGQWWASPSDTRGGILLGILAFSLLLVLLFYPYLQVTRIYDGAARTADEILATLPRLESYVLSDRSWLWSSRSRMFDALPMRYEHQMFIGAIPLVLAVAGYWLGRRAKPSGFALIPGALAVLVLLTLSVGGFSLWLLFAKLPLASAIRTMSRIDLVLLFPVAYLAAIGIEAARSRSKWIPPVLAILLIVEFAAVSLDWDRKEDWRSRLQAAEAALPEDLPPGSILFFAQKGEPLFAADLDAMWIALNHRIPTMNGLSGFSPPGFSFHFGADCEELPKRVYSYIAFTGRAHDLDAYIRLINRVVPIGFAGCDARWAEFGRSAPSPPRPG